MLCIAMHLFLGTGGAVNCLYPLCLLQRIQCLLGLYTIM